MKRAYKDKPKPEKIKKTVRVWVPPIKTSSGVRFGYWTKKEVEGDALNSSMR